MWISFWFLAFCIFWHHHLFDIHNFLALPPSSFPRQKVLLLRIQILIYLQLSETFEFHFHGKETQKFWICLICDSAFFKPSTLSPQKCMFPLQIDTKSFIYFLRSNRNQNFYLFLARKSEVYFYSTLDIHKIFIFYSQKVFLNSVMWSLNLLFVVRIKAKKL